MRQYFELNDKYKTNQKLWDSTKATVQTIFISVKEYILKRGKTENLGAECLFQEITKKQQLKPKKLEMEEVRDLRGGINEMENESTIEIINKVKNWFFEKTSKIYKP